MTKQTSNYPASVLLSLALLPWEAPGLLSHPLAQDGTHISLYLLSLHLMYVGFCTYDVKLVFLLLFCLLLIWLLGQLKKKPWRVKKLPLLLNTSLPQMHVTLSFLEFPWVYFELLYFSVWTASCTKQTEEMLCLMLSRKPLY